MASGPLWMPNGSVRSVLAMSVILSIPVMLIMQIPVPAEYWGFAGTVIALYFGNRGGESKEDASALSDELKALKASQAATADQVLKQNSVLLETVVKAGVPATVLPNASKPTEQEPKP